jgi:hypothetical protein
MTIQSRRQLADRVKGFRSYMRRRYRNDVEFRRTLLAQLRIAVRVQAQACEGKAQRSSHAEARTNHQADVVVMTAN